MTIREAIAILELQSPVSHDDVRKAFRAKAKLYHPDRHRDERLQEQASKQFISARQASEFLLNRSEAVINSPEAQRRPDPVVRRPFRTPPPPPKIVDAPIVKELDNVVKLVQLALGNKWNSKSKKLRWNFTPGSILGRWYEELIEKHYPGEDKLNGAAFAFYRFFRLLFGAIFLIAAFLIMGILGLLAAVLFFPPLIVFYALYSLYSMALESVAEELNKQVKRGDITSWITARYEYLWYRTIPLALFGLACWGTITFGKTGTIYLESISWLICLPVLMLVLSVTYEWLHYRRIVIRQKNQSA